MTSVRPDEPCHADVLLELANGRAAVNPEREMQNYAIADDAAFCFRWASRADVRPPDIPYGPSIIPQIGEAGADGERTRFSPASHPHTSCATRDAATRDDACPASLERSERRRTSVGRGITTSETSRRRFRARPLCQSADLQDVSAG